MDLDRAAPVQTRGRSGCRVASRSAPFAGRPGGSSPEVLEAQVALAASDRLLDGPAPRSDRHQVQHDDQPIPRSVRMAAELGLGDLAPRVTAMADFSMDGEVSTLPRKRAKTTQKPCNFPNHFNQ